MKKRIDLVSLVAVLLFISLFAKFSSAETGVVVFTNMTASYVSTPQYQTWNRTVFSNSSNATNVYGTISWTVMKNNPVRKEQILGTLDENLSLKIQFYNSTGWSQTYNLTTRSGSSAKRGFDIGVEQQSGDVMVAYNNGSVGMFEYQVWNGTAWYKNGTVTTNATTSQVDWIKMSSKSYSNTLLLAAVSGSELDVFSWDGSAWSSSKRLETSLETGGKEDFDIAYEDSSGDGIAVWANSATAAARYANFSGNVWSAAASAPASGGQTNNFQWLRLSSYPNSDRIMMCTVDAGADLNCEEWTGGGWGTVTELDPTIEYANGSSFRNFDVMPDTSSGSFFVLYGDQDVDYFTSRRCFGSSNCQAGTWEAAQILLSGVDIGTDTGWASLSFDPENVGKITAIMADEVTDNWFRARIGCANSSNSCAADQASVLLANALSTYESAMFQYQGIKPTLTNISANSHYTPSSQIVINTTGANDLNNNTVYLYCSTSSAPTASNTVCSGGATSQGAPYGVMNCTYTSQSTEGNYTTFCRIYDGFYYSQTYNVTYAVDGTPPTTSLVSVAGDTAASYIDTVNDGITAIVVSGEADMTCRWSPSDLAYSLMSNSCTTTGSQANCTVNDITAEGFYTRHVACADSPLGNGQNSTQNVDVQFYLDYTPPTTSDNSTSDFHLPNYTLTIFEGDAVDSNPSTYYCTSQTQGCTPTTSIDNLGQITYNSSDRGANYLRYYSVDFAGNTQVTVNKTINMNQFPVFLSATDNSDRIKGGSTVNVSTVSYDSDSGQNFTLYVCQTQPVSSAGCSLSYCSSSGTANLTCTFTSETDSTNHTWFAYIYDALNETSASNFSGSYITDSQAPAITIIKPENTTYPQGSLTSTIVVNEPLSWAGYSLSGSGNVTMMNLSVYYYTWTNSSIANGAYTITFYANDTVGNMANSSSVSFTIDTSANDNTAPVITVLSPINNSYYTSANVLFNISTDEALNWAGYSADSGSLTTLGNYTSMNWNKTVTLADGQHTVIFYANDTSANRNSGNKTVNLYVDLNNPGVTDFSCTSTVNDTQDVICSANVTDTVGLSYAIIRHNATGSFTNSSQISLSGTSSNLSYTISSSLTNPPAFTAELHLQDASGRTNTTSFRVTVNDNTPPQVYNISYVPSTAADIDIGTRINVSADIVDNYWIGSVVLMYKNSSSADWTSTNMTNYTANTYNASFIVGNETWQFKINATDTSANQNVSEITTFIANNDTTFFNSTSIPDIKSFTLAQAAGNNTLGYIFLNNTGDTTLTFALTANSTSIGTLVSINRTANQTVTYVVGALQSINLSVEVNTTSLPAGLYDYSINISSAAGTTKYSKQLNIQTATGPYLSVTIDTYSSTVNPGQTGIELSATVQNLGTTDATAVYLNWSLPSEFSITSGSAQKSVGNLPVGGTGTNSVTISVSSSASNVSRTIMAFATSSENVTANASKTVQIGTAAAAAAAEAGAASITVIGGGGGGAVLQPEKVEFSRQLEVTRGQEYVFDIELYDKYDGYVIEDARLILTGYPSQYIEIAPEIIARTGPRQTQLFKVKLKAPAYQEHNEYALQGKITGTLVSLDGVTRKGYTEIQNIKLITQEVSREEVQVNLADAESAIKQMADRGFNTKQAEELLAQAKQKMQERSNREAQDFANQIVQIRQTAENADRLIRNTIEAMKNPKVANLVIGSVIRKIKGDDRTPLRDLMTGQAVLASKPLEGMLNMAIAAFERGDYATAEERAKEAQTLLLLERKGNPQVFIYLYWPQISVGLIILVILGILGYRMYQKATIRRRIGNLNKREDSTRKLMAENQTLYFENKISPGLYKTLKRRNEREIARIKKQRIRLRNRRIKLLAPEKVYQDLAIEKTQVENEIKRIQEKFYKSDRMSKPEYESQFSSLNERLAEIEEERITLKFLEHRKSKAPRKGDARESQKSAHAIKRLNAFSRIRNYMKNKESKEEELIRKKVNEMLKHKR